jgi:hypothetical protein
MQTQSTILPAKTRLRSCASGALIVLRGDVEAVPAGPSLYRIAGALLVTTNWEMPSVDDMEEWVDGVCPTPCGCDVEPDGECEHGCPSWLMIVGFI